MLIASITSSELPIAQPSGSSILVSVAETVLPNCLPIDTISLASFLAVSRFFINAPEPTLTSSEITSVDTASFLLIIDDAIKGIDSTVPVTSLNE